MTDNIVDRQRITCQCGKNIQRRNYSQHCSSQFHLSYLNKVQSSSSNDSYFSLNPYLRENDLRTDRERIESIVQRYDNVDPYSKKELQRGEDQSMLADYHIDHIHEVQVLAFVIDRSRQFRPYTGNLFFLRPLKSTLNNVENFVLTQSTINQSKGQAIRYFLNNCEREREIPLLAAFLQTASGKERTIAQISKNIIEVIRETSSSFADSIRETRMDNGQITGHQRYEIVAEQFDRIIDRMNLDWSGEMKLRNGKISQAYR